MLDCCFCVMKSSIAYSVVGADGCVRMQCWSSLISLHSNGVKIYASYIKKWYIIKITRYPIHSFSILLKILSLYMCTFLQSTRDDFVLGQFAGDFTECTQIFQFILYQNISRKLLLIRLTSCFCYRYCDYTIQFTSSQGIIFIVTLFTSVYVHPVWFHFQCLLRHGNLMVVLNQRCPNEFRRRLSSA